EVVVDVAGKVHHPGLYRLHAGARVDDALRAAGGSLAGVELNSLNLAAKLSDGQQILVGLPASAGPIVGGGVAAGGDSAAPSASTPIDLNTATLAQLDALPGVGPVLAQHILDWRSEHGAFASVSQLQDVSGIGPSKYDSLHTLVTV
ncbi:MAG: helix-hairpin-helix domain-containing protein, partial [Actinobacteria bacterium]|nr:helix-hairpin-helix domain-containing protein [Actinomycetota bacterium]